MSNVPCLHHFNPAENTEIKWEACYKNAKIELQKEWEEKKVNREASSYWVTALKCTYVGSALHV